VALFDLLRLIIDVNVVNLRKMKLSIDGKLSLFLITGFVIFTVIGTLSHELGHFVMARALGYDARINYGYTYWEPAPSTEFNTIVTAEDPEIQKAKEEKDAFLITLAGPVVTILIGTAGLLLVANDKKKYGKSRIFDPRQWFLLFLSLFWLRPLFNFCTGSFVYFSRGNFPASNDEVELATYLHWNSISISLGSALVAVAVCTYLFFGFIPQRQRFTFICAALIGGSLGFYLWLHLLGPVLMP
jgi:hypothetical protein